jgi:transposase
MQKNGYFPENIGKRLSIDETALSNGELYTILTNNKAAKGKKGTIVAMIAGTKADCYSYYRKIPLKLRNTVSEITLDMAANMGLIKKCFPNATRVTDRFHVQKLALEALQEIRIKPLASH